MNNVIITGAGRGLGKALSLKFTNQTTNLIRIGRNIGSLGESSSNIINYDISNILNIDMLMKSILDCINERDCSKIILINNAGTIEPIDSVGKLENKDIEYNLTVNCISPILLINSFIKEISHLCKDIRIINVSSGVVHNPLEGWSLYSSAKSAVHSFISTIYYEQQHKEYPVKVVSFDPGVMNTSMQQYIRGVPVEKFNRINKFKEFYDQGLLRDPEFVAEKIEEIYIDNWLASGPFETIQSYEGK